MNGLEAAPWLHSIKSKHNLKQQLVKCHVCGDVPGDKRRHGPGCDLIRGGEQYRILHLRRGRGKQRLH